MLSIDTLKGSYRTQEFNFDALETTVVEARYSYDSDQIVKHALKADELRLQTHKAGLRDSHSHIVSALAPSDSKLLLDSTKGAFVDYSQEVSKLE